MGSNSPGDQRRYAAEIRLAAPPTDHPADAPLISVIVASYNSRDTIASCIASVAGQTYPHKQLIIMDGASKDGTVDILRDHDSQIHCWRSEPDHGISDAWNKALTQAQGQWICFLGSDDVFWEQDVLERMVPHLVRQPARVRVVYASMCVLSEDLEIIGVWGAPWETLKRGFVNGVMRVPHPGLMQHRTLFEEHGGFDESIRVVMDYEMLLRELVDHDACFIPGLMAVGMSAGGNSHVLKNRFVARRELRRVLKTHGLPTRSIDRVSADVKLWSVSAMQRVLGVRAAEAIRTRVRRRRVSASVSMRPDHPKPFVFR